MSPQQRRECNRLFLSDGCAIVIALRTILAMIRGEQVLAAIGLCLTVAGLVILTLWAQDLVRRIEIEKKWRK